MQSWKISNGTGDDEYRTIFVDMSCGRVGGVAARIVEMFEIHYGRPLQRSALHEPSTS